MRQVAVTDVSGIDAREWERLVPKSATAFYASPGWQQSITSSSTGTQCVAVRDQTGSTRGVVPFFAYPTGHPNPFMDAEALFSASAPEIEPELWRPLTLVGSRAGYANDVVATDIDSWIAALQPLADHAGVVLVPYLHDSFVQQESSAISDAFPDAQFLLTKMRSVIAIHGTTMKNQLATLSKKRRDRISNEIRKIARGNRTVNAEPLAETALDELAELFARTQQRHSARGTAAQYRQSLDEFVSSPLADDCVVFSCREKGETIACTLNFRYRDTLVARAAGLNYDRVGQHAEYINVLLYSPLQYAIEHNFSSIDLGLETKNATKSMRGAELLPMWTLLLRPPPGWTQAHTTRHNAARFGEWLTDFGNYLTPQVSERLTTVMRASGA